ncbi:MAG: diaminopimelate epimerase [Methanobacteriota archaeon]|nr:MAG: diaminopimelate epimerase [Euryarchaeota archaeon]
MRFYKYHGAGNDFIVIDNRDSVIEESEKKGLAVRLCHRHFGIGGDGLVLVEPSDKGDARMRIFNPDGSEAEMCGNAIRCVAKHLYESGLVKESITIETLSGLKEAALTIEKDRVRYVSVDMGSPKDVALNRRLNVKGSAVECSYLDTGVPHAVIFVEDVDALDIEKRAPPIRFNPSFQRGANVDFVQKLGEGTFKIRTYERGVERETLACGTGITAAAAAAVLLGLAEKGSEIEVRARGGTVFVKAEGGEDGEMRLIMRGPAEFVFEGDVPAP